MLSVYVCRQCRTRLSRRITPVRSPQWQPRASIVSLAGRKPNDSAEKPSEEAVASPRVEENYTQEPNRNGPNIRYSAPRDGQLPRSRYSRLMDDETGQAPTYTGYARGEEEHASSDVAQKGSSRAVPAFADSVLNALRDGHVNGAWQAFESIYTARDCKALMEPTCRDAKLLSEDQVFARLLRAVTGAFCANRPNLQVTPTAVLFKYEQLGIARKEYWVRPTIGHLTYEIIRAINSPSGSKRDIPSLVTELLSVWRLFFQCMGPGSGPTESVSTEWHLPAIEAMPDMHSETQFNLRLQEYIPNYVSSPALAFCAVYFYSISDALDPKTQTQAAPFLAFLRRLLAGSHVDSVLKHTQTTDFNKLSRDVQAIIMREIDAAPRKALVAIGKAGENLGSSNAGDEYSNLEAFYMTRIERAVLTKSSAATLDGIWKEIEQTYTAENKTVAIPIAIYNAFLSGYMTVLNPERSVEVWNHMIANKVRPNMHSWVALLEGCANAKDLDGFNAMWQRMLRTGLEPSNYAWTTRVNGLMSLRQVDQAFVALDDMGKRWVGAENALVNSQKQTKGQKGPKKVAVNTCTKPSIEVVNGAISAIVQIRPLSMRHEKKVELVQKLLTWSKNFQIRPDAITYNSLIKLYLTAGDKTTAFNILAQMEKAGLEGDAATHTMLISAAFDNQVFDNMSETQQTERILKILNDLEASGVKMNDYIYATAIDRLLKKYANFHATRAVMEHMTSRKFVPSVHVYTSLITHYFQSDPPNIAGVDDVVLRLFSTARMPSDRVLFDRLLEGYASFGEVGKMMSVLTRMSKQKNLPGWGAMAAVVRALAQNGDYDRARAIVRDVARGEGVARGGIKGDRAGEAYFTRVIRELGLQEGTIWDYGGDDGRGVADMEGEMMGQQQSTTYFEQTRNAQYGQQQQQYQPPPVMDYSHEGTNAGLEQDPGNVDDNVHDFLRDEPEQGGKRV
jgi:pentatricopeptide repeat protein